jgi:hypothetical protein
MHCNDPGLKFIILDLNRAVERDNERLWMPGNTETHSAAIEGNFH